MRKKPGPVAKPVEELRVKIEVFVHPDVKRFLKEYPRPPGRLIDEMVSSKFPNIKI